MAACTASASLPASSTTVSTADAPTAAETVTPAAETAGLAHLQPVPPPSKPPPSLLPSLPDTDRDEGSESEGAEGSNAASVAEARRAARCVDMMNEAVEEGDYQLNNSVVRNVVKEALELQGYSMDQEPRGNKVKLSEVQAFVFEALGVEADKKKLRPIVEQMLEALAFARDEKAAEKRGQKLTREYIQREHGSYIRRRNQPAWMTPRTSPFDGVTPITKHNAWRYEDAKPKLTECRDKKATRSASSCRTPDSEPGRFYRQVMGKEWDGENHSFDLASKKFRRLLPDNRRDEQEREQRRQRHKGRRTQGKGIAKAARPSSTTLNATGGAAVSPPPAQPTSGATGSSLATESFSSSVADKPRATGSATSSAPASSSVVLTAAAKPQRDDERFGGDYKAYRRADRAWHEQRRRDRLKSSAPYDLPRREPSNGRSARAAVQHAQPQVAKDPFSSTSATRSVRAIAADLVAVYAERQALSRDPCTADDDRMSTFEAAFSHRPTEDQQRAFDDVASDMIASRQPMDRLVCGDVGFGKTEVAMRACYRAVCARRQVALLAPSVALANQHYRSLLMRMPKAVVVVEVMSSQMTASEAIAVRRAIGEGTVNVVVGTSSLLSADVAFTNLGLLIIDEEQRFGVRQKDTIKRTKRSVDVLSLSATPIPRTLYMCETGIRAISLLTTPPEGRLAVATTVSERCEAQILSAVSAELGRGGQVLVIVPRKGMVHDEVAMLRSVLPAATRVDFAHAGLADLDTRISNFSMGTTHVLVATTVLETGIDITNLNTIIIHDAVRTCRHARSHCSISAPLNDGSTRCSRAWQHLFGLQTLHQLRGRVGRSSLQAHAYLMHPPGEQLKKNQLERLRVIQEETALGAGLNLSRRDLALRGTGNLFGEAQKGTSSTIRGAVNVELYRTVLQRVARVPSAADPSAAMAVLEKTIEEASAADVAAGESDESREMGSFEPLSAAEPHDVCERLSVCAWMRG